MTMVRKDFTSSMMSLPMQSIVNLLATDQTLFKMSGCTQASMMVSSYSELCPAMH